MNLQRLRQWIWLVWIPLAIVLAACSPTGSPTATPAPQGSGGDSESSVSPAAEYRTMTIDEFAEVVENRADEYTIVNVHIPYEGEVANTDAQIPFNDIEALTAALPDKDAPIILYCRSGRMSSEAANEMVALGYTNLYDVPGGMNAWRASGRELLDNPPQNGG